MFSFVSSERELLFYAPASERLRVVNGEVITRINGEIAAFFVRDQYFVDVLASGADHRGDVALGEANGNILVAVRLPLAVLLAEGHKLSGNPAFRVER